MKPISRKRKLFFSLVMIGVVLLLIEAGIRVNDFVHGSSAHARGQWFWAFQQDRFLGYRARENVDMTSQDGHKIDTNSAGFRDLEVPVSSESPRRLVICQGESSTWGTGASDRNHTWPHFLGCELRQASSEPFVTLNAGMPGYTTLENVQLLQMRLLKYKPEAIVYMGFRNDYVYYATMMNDNTDVDEFPRQLAPLADTWINRTLMRSSLFTIVASAWGRKFPLDYHGFTPVNLGKGVTRRGEALFRDQIALMNTICRRHSVSLLWVDQPITPSMKQHYEKTRNILHDELKRQGIPLISAETLYDHAAAPMLDDVHFSDAGNEQLAKIIAPQVLGLLRQGNASSTAAAAGGAKGAAANR